MKKILFILAALTITNLGVCQPGTNKAAVGGALIYGSEIRSLGFNILGSFSIKDNIRVAPDLSYFIPHHNDYLGWREVTDMFEINLNGHYLFPVVQNQIDIYPLVGFNLAFLTFRGEPKNPDLIGNPKYDYRKNEIDPGLNIGVGGDYLINDKLNFLLELRYAISNYSQFAVKAGVAYLF
jgi:hypothetical protein